MPELPDVEKAAALIRSVASGKKIERVETTEDTIVFTGIKHQDFAKELTGRVVKTAGRYGKVFYIELDGNGRQPVMHFGMTGTLQIKGEKTTIYRSQPGKKDSQDWPPRFMKFILHIQDSASNEVTEMAFCDARRLGRIRLCASPLTEPPISELGFDPMLCMPPYEEFKALVIKRSCPIKALLLDQSFSAGVGNWVADEILYHARVHPEQRCNTLTEMQLTELHNQTYEVCRIAVEANADDSKFPDNWLFKHRWGKGKKDKHTMKLPSGEPATIKWLTVGGRTSAFVAELQPLQSKSSTGAVIERDVRVGAQDDTTAGYESDLTPSEEGETSVAVGKKRKLSTKRAAGVRRTKQKTAEKTSVRVKRGQQGGSK